MICFDTNIVVYVANRTLKEDIVQEEPIVYASILKVEALGYHNIRSVEEQRIRELLATVTEIPLTETIIESAIRLRQQKKMSLGDAIVAATALDNDCVLWTANTDDFADIEGLKVVNPLVEFGKKS